MQENKSQEKDVSTLQASQEEKGVKQEVNKNTGLQRFLRKYPNWDARFNYEED